jgi:hypothetical protein
MRFSWALTHRLVTMVGSAALAALAFSRHTRAWDIVGAVLIAFAIVDAILLAVVAWFRWRHREE